MGGKEPLPIFSAENLQRAKLLTGIAARVVRAKAEDLTFRAKNAWDQVADPELILKRAFAEKFSALRRAGMGREDAHRALLKITKVILDEVVANDTKPASR